MAKYSEDQIRNYAHRLWEKEGKPEGKSDEFWRQAEIELDADSEMSDPGDQPNAKNYPRIIVQFALELAGCARATPSAPGAMKLAVSAAQACPASAFAPTGWKSRT